MPRMLPVLLGGDANVYGMARSFYECYGVRSLAVCRRALPALAHSRLVRVAVQDPAFGQDHVFTATLLGLAAQSPGVPKILISCADDYTALLARHADALRGAYRFACPPPAALHLADKRQFAAACRAAGLRTPQTVTLCPADALPPLPFGWPVIAKPADQAAYARCDFPGRRKVYLVQDAARLRELLAAAARGGYFGGWLVQEYIPGPDTRLGVVNAYCAADGSVPWLVQGQPLLQERTPEGTGNYAAVLVEPSRQDAALLDALRGLLQAAGWHGFANFDIKRDPQTGVEYFLDCNPRIGRNSYYNVAGGVNPMRIMVEEALGLGEGEKGVEKRGAGDKDSAGEKSDEVAKKTSTYAKSTSKKSVHIADQEALYTLVPLQLLRRYIRDPQLLSEVNGLIAQKKVANPQHYKADRGSKRMMNVFLTEYNQLRKFAKYYPKPTDSSF